MTESDARLELWLVDLEQAADALAALERAEPRLAPDDIARAVASAEARDRRHRLATYTALRILLERASGPGVRRVPLTRAPGTKPTLGSGAADFSLSHAEGFALIGVAPAPPLGVDLEGVRPVRMVPHRKVEIVAIGRALSPHPLPDAPEEETFIQAWTRLEAFSKARGCGLSQTLTDIGARGSPRERPPLPELHTNAQRIMAGAGVSVHDLQLGPGLHGAVAAAPDGRAAQLRVFPTDMERIAKLLGPGASGNLSG